MNCRAARRAMVERLLGSELRADELAVHLRSCSRCREALEKYRAVREGMKELGPVSPPEPVVESLRQRVEEALGAGPDPALVAARPDPERSLLYKTVVFTAVMLLVVGIMAAALVLLPRAGEPVEPVATVTEMIGEVRCRVAGSETWQRVHAKRPLWPGTTIRTGEEGLARISTEGATWSLDSGSALGLGERGMAEPVFGRLCVDADRPENEPLRLVSRQGTVRCTRARLVVTTSVGRMRVACLGGEARLALGEEAQMLAPGRCVMLVDGAVCGPMRPVSGPAAVLWLRKFPDAAGGRLTARQLAALPVGPEQGTLPSHVTPAALDLDITVRGPLALLDVRAVLRNEGEKSWKGELSAGDLMLPVPLAVASASVAVAPGEEAEVRTAAVCALRYRDGRGALGVNPRVWSDAVRRLRVRMDASTTGGFRTVSCPLAGLSARGQEQVSWEYSETEAGACEPMVFEFVPARAHAVDALELSGGLLLGWRLPRWKHRWLTNETRLLVAFDATADFGPGGRCHAQEVMERILGALPVGSRTALAAYDGSLKVEQSPMSRHTPARVEAMLAGLWKLQAGPPGKAGSFVENALGLSALPEGGRTLLYVTGRGRASGPAGAALEEAVEKEVRVLALQIGAHQPSAALRRLCRATGGAAMAVPARMAPELAAGDFLAALSRPAVEHVALHLEGGGMTRILPAEGGFAVQPVVALLESPPAGALEGSFHGLAGGRELQEGFALERGPVALAGRPGERLVEALRAALARM